MLARAERAATRRPDRGALWAVLLAGFAVLVAAASAHASTTGGVAVPPTGQPPAAGQAPGSGAATGIGWRPLTIGVTGPDVDVLQGLLRAKGFGPAKLTGQFDPLTAEAVRRFKSSAQLPPDGVVDQTTAKALLNRMRPAKASFYGPGFYGNRTACGTHLTTRTLGVAHRTLPCGTLVTVEYGGRLLRTKVIDRGPFRSGYSWDLTAAAAKQLGMTVSSTVRTVHERPSAARAHATAG